MKILTVLLLFLMPIVGTAATRYVSNSATNGYAVGTDSGAAATKGAPWLTMSYAVANASSGDTIVANCGTYTNTGSLTPAATNLIIQSEIELCATITSSSGTNSVLLVNLAASGIAVRDVILDGAGTKNAGVTFDPSNDVTASFYGTRVINTRTNGMTSMARVTSLTMDGNWSIVLNGDSGTTQNGINGVPSQTSTWNIQNGSVSQTCPAAATTACNGILLSPTGALTATITNVKVAQRGVSGAGEARGLYSEGVPSLTINNLDTSYTGDTSVTYYGIIIPNDAVDTSTISVINSDVVADDFGQNTNIGIQIGNNALPAVSNKVVVSKFSNNSTKNTNHGILFGYIQNAQGSNNFVWNAYTGLVAKVVTGSSGFFNNFVYGYPFDDGALRSRGSTNNFFAHNAVYIDKNATTSALPIYVNDSPEGANSGTQYVNNIIEVVPTGIKAVDVDSGDTATFTNNSYDTGNPNFEYQASSYASLSAWISAQETLASGVASGFVKGPSISKEFFKLKENSSNLGSGSFTSLVKYDAAGYRFSTPRNRGPYSLSRDFSRVPYVAR